MKILVTGASGFLGKFLCKALRKFDHGVVEINSKNCDLTKESSLERFSNIKFDRIYHLAAWTQAGDFCLYHPGEQWIINQKINTNVLSWWQTKEPQAKMICMGTSCSYASNVALLEENYMEGTPIDSLFAYAMAKRMLYVGLKALNKQFGLKYLYLIPSTLYGPNYHADGRQMHFIFDLIRKILKGKLYNETPILWGDGYQKRELIHVEDFVDALLKLSDIDNEIINIGSGKEHTMREFAKQISQIIDYDVKKIEFDASKFVGARSKVLLVDKLKTFYPAFKPRELTVGLKQVIDWFLENQHLLQV